MPTKRTVLDHLRDEQPSVKAIINQLKLCYETWGRVGDEVGVNGQTLSRVSRGEKSLSDELEKKIRLAYDRQQSSHTIAFDMAVLLKQSFTRIRSRCDTMDEAYEELDRIEPQIDNKIEDLNATAT